MDLNQINKGLELIAESSYKVYHYYAKTKADYENLKKHRDSMRSMISIMKYSGAKSEAEKKRLSEADPDYINYQAGLDQAERKYLKASASVKTLEIKLSCYQSLSKNYLKDNQN